jgi:hypothetical protein
MCPLAELVVFIQLVAAVFGGCGDFEVLPHLLAHHLIAGVFVVYVERPHEVPGEVALVVVVQNAVASHVAVPVFDDTEGAVADGSGGEWLFGCFEPVADSVYVVEPSGCPVAVRLSLPRRGFDRVNPRTERCSQPR